MSEELTKLIDKTIGKKGRLRVPAYWMHKVLSGIVGYFNGLVKWLDNRLSTVESTVESLNSPMEITPYSLATLKPNKRHLILDLIARNASYSEFVLESNEAAEYTLYCFLNENSVFLIQTKDFIHNIPARSEFGFYEVKFINTNVGPNPIFQFLATPSLHWHSRFIHLRHTGTPGDSVVISTSQVYQNVVYFDGKPLEDLQFTLNSSHADFIVFSKGGQSLSPYTKGNKTLKLVEICGDDRPTIEASAFEGSTSLTKVVLPESTKYIQERAFYGCTSLSTVVIPDSVALIEQQAFYHVAISYFRFPNSLTRIEYGVLQNSVGLYTVIIPNSVTSIGEYAFNGCSKLDRINLENHTSIPTLDNVNALEGTSGALKIVVPDALYDDWVISGNWSTYADHIVKASEQ